MKRIRLVRVMLKDLLKKRSRLRQAGLLMECKRLLHQALGIQNRHAGFGGAPAFIGIVGAEVLSA